MPTTTITVTYQALSGLVEYGDNYWMVAYWTGSGAPYMAQLLQFSKASGALTKHEAFDPYQLSVGKLEVPATYASGGALLAGDDLAIGGRLRDHGQSIRRLEPVLVGSHLWLGFSGGLLLSWDLTTGARGAYVTGIDSDVQGTYYTPLCEANGKLLCVYERVRAQENSNDYLGYNGSAADWYLNMIQSMPTPAPVRFMHWLECVNDTSPVSMEMGLCLVDSDGTVSTEEAFTERELRGYAPAGVEERIDTHTATESATAEGGPIGGVYEGRTAWESVAAPSPPYELEPRIYSTPYKSGLPALASNDAEVRVVQWAELGAVDISFDTGPLQVQTETGLIWPSAYDALAFVGFVGHRYVVNATMADPTYTYGSRPTSVGCRVSGSSPATLPGSPVIRLRRWVRRTRARYQVRHTVPPKHSVIDCCATDTLVVFGPRPDYTGTNFTWAPGKFYWVAYSASDLSHQWTVSIDGESGTRRQSRPIIAAGRVLTIIADDSMTARLVQISLQGAILDQTTLAAMGLPADLNETCQFEMTSDGESVYVRSDNELWKVTL